MARARSFLSERVGASVCAGERRSALVAMFGASLVASCGFYHDEGIDGPYRLVAVDISVDMDVCYEVEGGCVERIPETVFAVGWSSKFIVAARHPHAFAETRYDRSRTEYFYIVRSQDGPMADPSACVRGPLSRAQFDDEKRRLGLPELTHILDSLK